MNDIGILPLFKGIAVHDFWKSYYRYEECKHSLCNAHLLRDLVFIKERFEQKWSEELISLLLRLLGLKNKALARGQKTISKITLKKYELQYDKIIKKGLRQNPYKPPPEKKRGKKKKTPPINLLERFRDYKKDILRFFYDFKGRS